MNKILYIFFVLSLFTIIACRHQEAAANGNDNGGFERIPVSIMSGAPGMILIEGGAFAVKDTDGSVVMDTIHSFFISETEETNSQYLAYLDWLKKRFSYYTYSKALPDTTVWLKENYPDSIKRFLMKQYLRHPAYSSFPVVGLSPQQIEKYYEWKTDRLNEMILVYEGVLDYSSEADSTDYFTTPQYLGGNNKYERSLVPGNVSRRVTMEDGILMPRYRIAEQEEWKYAALAIGDSMHTYIKTPKPVDYRKYDKKHYYYYFYNRDIPPVSNWSGMPLIIKNEGPMRAYTAQRNYYHLYGMNDNVRELVKQGNNYGVAGGSWKFPDPDYSARYDKAGSNGARYSRISIPPVNISKNEQVSAATGFRLVMTYTTGIYAEPGGKRRKVKP